MLAQASPQAEGNGYGYRGWSGNPNAYSYDSQNVHRGGDANRRTVDGVHEDRGSH